MNKKIKSNVKPNKRLTSTQQEINTDWRYLAGIMSQNLPLIIESGQVERKPFPPAITYRFELFNQLLLNAFDKTAFRKNASGHPRISPESEAVYNLVRTIMEQINDGRPVTDASIRKQFEKFESLRMALRVPHLLSRSQRKHIREANLFFQMLYAYQRASPALET